jgi:hypothetical protein
MMADNNNGFDPCECIMSPAAAMQRLLNLVILIYDFFKADLI